MGMPPFLRSLRAKIGDDLIVLPCAAAFVVRDDGLVLVIRHADNGKWTFPGGCVEPDEAPENAVVREVAEETGLLVEPIALLSVGGGPEYRVVYPNGDEVSYVSSLYECHITGGTLAPDGIEALEAAFVPVEELRQLDLSQICRANLERALIARAEREA
jgi:ADP-ribose pyrophosphatase YjhB (NUDIX family)